MLRDDELSLETISKLLTELQDKEKLKMGIAMANSRPSNVESKILEELSVLLTLASF